MAQERSMEVGDPTLHRSTAAGGFTDDMVERMAVRIFVSWYEGSFCAPVSFYTDCDHALREDYRRIARASLGELLEPTPAMVGAGNKRQRRHGVAHQIFRDMIKTALEMKPTRDGEGVASDSTSEKRS